MVVDYDGRILCQADPGPGEKIVVGPIDPRALHERGRRRTTFFAPGGPKPILIFTLGPSFVPGGARASAPSNRKSGVRQLRKPRRNRRAGPQ